MKAPPFVFAMVLTGTVFAAEAPPAATQPPPATAATQPAPATAPATPVTRQATKPPPAKIRFRGKAGAPTNCTVTATRSGQAGGIRLISMAPGDEGVTQKARPRLWWYQSEPTGPRELEFTLSRMDGPKPKELMRRHMPAMPKGFNCVDFTHKGFNPESIELSSGAIYQWTVRLVSEKTAPQVFCRMKVKVDPKLAATPDLQELSESGNWYELFDSISTAAQESSPDSTTMADLRHGLLEQIGLSKALK